MVLLSLLLTILTWAILPLVFGLATSLIIPVIAPSLPRGRDRIAALCFDMASKSLQSGAISVRENGKPSLVATDRDPAFGAYKRKVDATGHVRDSMQAVRYLNGKSLGLTTNEMAIFVEPWFCAVGNEVDRADRNEMTDLKRVDPVKHDPSVDDARADGGDVDLVPASLETVPFRNRYQAVDLRDAIYLAPGSAQPDSGTQSKEFVEKSQEMFGETFTAEQMLGLLAAYAVPVALIWFAVNYGDAAAVDGVEVGMMGVIR